MEDSGAVLNVRDCDDHSKNQVMSISPDSYDNAPIEIQDTIQTLDESFKSLNFNDLSVHDSETLNLESEKNAKQFASSKGIDIDDKNKQTAILLLFTCCLIS